MCIHVEVYIIFLNMRVHACIMYTHVVCMVQMYHAASDHFPISIPMYTCTVVHAQ